MEAKIRISPASCFLCRYEKLDLATSTKCQGCFIRGKGRETKPIKQREAEGILQDSKGFYVLREVKYADEDKGNRDTEPALDLAGVCEGSRAVDNGEGVPEIS